MPNRLPGFYADTRAPGVERYWDGEAWTEQYRRRGETGAYVPPRASRSWQQDRAGGIVTAGYICAVLFPLAGIALGYIATTRSSRATSEAGPRIMILSVVCLALWLTLGVVAR